MIYSTDQERSRKKRNRSITLMLIGIIVLFVGKRLTDRLGFLEEYSIPEPVSGGLIAAFLALMVVLLTGREISYDLTARDALLVYFFTTIGLNARLSDLLGGGRPLAIMLGLTIAFMVVQTVVGVFRVGQKHLPAKIHGLLPIGLRETVEVGAFQRFNTVDIAVHTGIKSLGVRCIGD